MSLWNPADAASYYFLVSRVSAIRQKYEAEDTQYERYSDFTDKKVEEGREEGIAIGKEEGIAIGEERGKLEEKREIARKMKRDGLSVEAISNYTGLSKDEIESLE
jgi:predicted transposase/invertase (TIGR01784 family)